MLLIEKHFYLYPVTSFWKSPFCSYDAEASVSNCHSILYWHFFAISNNINPGIWNFSRTQQTKVSILILCFRFTKYIPFWGFFKDFVICLNLLASSLLKIKQTWRYPTFWNSQWHENSRRSTQWVWMTIIGGLCGFLLYL